MQFKLAVPSARARPLTDENVASKRCAPRSTSSSAGTTAAAAAVVSPKASRWARDLRPDGKTSKWVPLTDDGCGEFLALQRRAGARGAGGAAGHDRGDGPVRERPADGAGERARRATHRQHDPCDAHIRRHGAQRRHNHRYAAPSSPPDARADPDLSPLRATGTPDLHTSKESLPQAGAADTVGKSAGLAKLLRLPGWAQPKRSTSGMPTSAPVTAGAAASAVSTAPDSAATSAAGASDNYDSARRTSRFTWSLSRGVRTADRTLNPLPQPETALSEED